MKNFKRVALLFLLLILIFAGHTLVSTGFFRTVVPKLDGKIIAKIPLKGAEDLMVSQSDSFVLISSTDRASFPAIDQDTGGLYLIDLKAEGFKPISLTANFKKPFAPHGISFFKKDSAYQVVAINHTKEGHAIEVFELNGKMLTHIRTLENPSMIRPNDIVLIDENQFYFTNDHGYTEGVAKLIEEYGGFDFGNVVYFDSNKYTEVADGIAYANGINFDPERNLLFVASVRKFLIKVYTKNPDGTLSFIESIPCGTGVDNIEFDEEGNIWVGCHPNLLRFNAYAKGKKEKAPSEIIKITYRGKGDYSVEQIYAEEGEEMSGASVAATFGNLIFAGNVMDDSFLVLER